MKYCLVLIGILFSIEFINCIEDAGDPIRRGKFTELKNIDQIENCENAEILNIFYEWTQKHYQKMFPVVRLRMFQFQNAFQTTISYAGLFIIKLYIKSL